MSNRASHRFRWFASALGLLASLGVTFALSGCNTVEGAGRDIEAAGQGIEDAAD